MACSTCNCTNNTCGCKDLPLTTQTVYTCPPNLTCPDGTPCYETIQDTCVKHSTDYSIVNFGAYLAGGDAYPALPAGASLENAYQAMSIQTYNSNCPPVINFRPTYIGTTAVVIAWETTSADTYTLSYGTVAGGPYTTVSGITSNTYTLTNLTPGTTYYMFITTVCGIVPYTSSGAIIALTTLTA
jgi:hypothetical protein